MSDQDGEPQHVLVAVTGSVAAIKVPELVKQLTLQQESKIPSLVYIHRFWKSSIKVEVVATKAGLYFFDPSTLPVKCHTDEDEWKWTKKGDPVLHIELRKWADLLVIAPLSANTMAKMANGICDNLLACIVRAWDPKRPLLYCPAMNTYMWDHPLTSSHLRSLTDFGYIQVPPVTKLLACGDQGVGAMAHVPDIVEAVLKHLKLQKRTTIVPLRT